MLSSLTKPGRVAWAVTLVTLAIFGGLVAGITWQLRESLREEVLRREAEALHAVALMQLHEAEERDAFAGEERSSHEVFAAVLESSRLRGVLAVQLFDPAGNLRTALPFVETESVGARWWPPALPAPGARYVAAGSLEEALRLTLDDEVEFARVPLVDVVVPLRAGANGADFLGVARYWMDGEPIAAEFRRMDRRLAWQAGIAFAGGAVLVALVLAWAFAGLAEANRRLTERSADLARANEELDFAAKTGALGAISAHLIHGLKNPLAGIEGFVQESAIGSPNDARGEACRTAMDTTRRLRGLVNEVATVLRDEADGAPDFPVPVTEVVAAARVRSLSLAERADVALNATADPELQVSARTANLVGLVLANLLTNAIEASGAGSQVTLEGRRCAGGVEFLVRDGGPGLPPEVRRALFRPVRSSKRGGGGMGLAISQRLAKHANGDLTLLSSDSHGTTFRLFVSAAGTVTPA